MPFTGGPGVCSVKRYRNSAAPRIGPARNACRARVSDPGCDEHKLQGIRHQPGTGNYSGTGQLLAGTKGKSLFEADQVGVVDREDKNADRKDEELHE